MTDSFLKIQNLMAEYLVLNYILHFQSIKYDPMKRREFIHAAALGSLALSIPQVRAFGGLS